MDAGDAIAAEVTDGDIDAIRDHPAFRVVAVAYAAGNLAWYTALAPIERWLLNDMGRASLSGAAIILAARGRLTPASLLSAAPVRRGEVSRSRARLYLQRVMAHGLIVPSGESVIEDGDPRLVPGPRFNRVLSGVLREGLTAAARLSPELAGALDLFEDPAFARRLTIHVAARLRARDLFPVDTPVSLFHERNGGARILEVLLMRQPPDRARFLSDCQVSHSALARAGDCSRTHVIQLLRDGQALGLLEAQGGRLVISPALSDDAERYVATLFALVRFGTLRALREA